MIDLTETMQFKFIAEDLSYQGDAGSWGSLIEAALDDFVLEYVASNSGLLGDVNNDEEVNVLDVVSIVNMIMGIEPLNYSAADINSDNEINVQDIIVLISMILD